MHVQVSYGEERRGRPSVFTGYVVSNKKIEKSLVLRLVPSRVYKNRETCTHASDAYSGPTKLNPPTERPTIKRATITSQIEKLSDRNAVPPMDNKENAIATFLQKWCQQNKCRMLFAGLCQMTKLLLYTTACLSKQERRQKSRLLYDEILEYAASYGHRIREYDVLGLISVYSTKSKLDACACVHVHARVV